MSKTDGREATTSEAVYQVWHFPINMQSQLPNNVLKAQIGKFATSTRSKEQQKSITGVPLFLKWPLYK